MKLALSMVSLIMLGSAAATAQEPREVWKFNAGSKIKFQTGLPSGDLFLSTESQTVRLSGDTGQVKWKRDDIVDCEKGNHPAGWAKVRLDNVPFVTCQVAGQWERLSFWGSYMRFESGIPDGTPGGILFQRCGVLRSCLEAGSLDGAPKAAMGGGWKSTHEDERLRLVNVETGEDAFDSTSAGIKRVAGTCLSPESVLMVWGVQNDGQTAVAFFDGIEGRQSWSGRLSLVRDIRCVALSTRLFLLVGQTDRGRRSVIAIDTAGTVRWESAELAKSDWGAMPVGLADTASTAILHVDEGGPVRVDLSTGHMQWRANVFKGSNPAGDGRGRNPRPQPIHSNGEHVFIVQESTIAALQPTTGAIAWTSKFSGPVAIMRSASDGLLLREYKLNGDSTLNMFRPQGGQKVWSVFVGSRQTGWLLNNETVYFIVAKKLQALSLESGQVREIGDVNFANDGSPTEIDLLGDALVVRSTEHIALFEPDGRMRYQKGYEAPGMSFGDKLLRMAVASAFTAASQYAAAQRAQSAANTAAYLRGGTASIWYTYNLYTPNFAVRLPIAAASERFAYLLHEQTDQPKGEGFYLVQIDKQDGRETGRLRSSRRFPPFFPQASSRVLVTTSESEVIAYEFGTAGI